MKSDRLLTVLGSAALLLVITNIVLYTRNHARQASYAARAQYVQQSLQLEPLYQSLVRGIAERAASSNDGELRALLTEQGISYTLTPEVGADKAAGSTDDKQGKRDE